MPTWRRSRVALRLGATAPACRPSPGMTSKTGSVKCSKGSSRFAVAMPGTDSCCLRKALLTLSCASACACISEKHSRLFFEPAKACRHTPKHPIYPLLSSLQQATFQVIKLPRSALQALKAYFGSLKLLGKYTKSLPKSSNVLMI